MKEKFKVGDKVKITNNDKVYSDYKNSFILNSVSNKLFKMFESGYVPHNNTFADVVAVGKHEWGNNIIYFIKENGHVSIIGESGIELVESNDEIAINRYGNKVVAKMGKKTGVARCNETDEFELYTGVKIAVDRLFGKDNEVKVVLENYKSQTEKPQEEKPKYYNGKAVCVEKSCTCDLYTVGKIYEFKNGITINDFDYESCLYTSIEDFNTCNSGDYKIIELVEDK